MAEDKNVKQETKRESPVVKKTHKEFSASNKGKKERKSSKDKKTSKYAQKKRKKIIRRVTKGRVYIKSTYNNTIVTFADDKGNVLAWASAGGAGFSGAKKATPYAAGIIARNAVEAVKPYGVEEVDVYLRGIGVGREAAVRGLQSCGIEVLSIKDITPIPHNGCRPKKPRRV